MRHKKKRKKKEKMPGESGYASPPTGPHLFLSPYNGYLGSNELHASTPSPMAAGKDAEDGILPSVNHASLAVPALPEQSGVFPACGRRLGSLLPGISVTFSLFSHIALTTAAFAVRSKSLFAHQKK